MNTICSRIQADQMAMQDYEGILKLHFVCNKDDIRRDAQTQTTRKTRQTQGDQPIEAPQAPLEHNRVNQQYADFSHSKLRPGFVFLSESDICGILYSSDGTSNVIKRTFQHASMTLAKNAAIADKGILVDTHFHDTKTDKRTNGYWKVSLQSNDDNDRKFNLKGAICTNSLELHLLEYDTTSPRKHKDYRNGDQDDDDDNLFQSLELDRNFRTIAMNCGTSSKQLRMSIAPNFGIVQGDADKSRKAIDTMIQDTIHLDAAKQELYKGHVKRLTNTPTNKSRQKVLREFVAEHIETPEEYKDDIDSGVTRIKHIGDQRPRVKDLGLLVNNPDTPSHPVPNTTEVAGREDFAGDGRSGRERAFCTKVYTDGLNRAKRRTRFAVVGQILNVPQINQQILPIVCNRLPTQTKTLTALCNSVDAHIPLIHEAQTELRTFYTSKIFMI
ncbi:hypothetical protein BGX31_000073 [Mortierella sp. GBA43]|nr:hypothetical protein BGX31_000073 [Mortierella sp. GBA43]